jgi:FtsZ-binding cell division protein ZapB
MNDHRRKKINQAIDLIETAKLIVQEVAEEENETYDNLPNGIKYSERGETMYESVQALEYSEDSFNALLDNLEEAKQ